MMLIRILRRQCTHRKCTNIIAIQRNIHHATVIHAKGKKRGVVEEIKPIPKLEHPMAFLDIFKDSANAPRAKPDEEYPDWLWTVHKPPDTLRHYILEFPNLSPNDQWRAMKKVRRISNWVKGGVRKSAKR